MQLFFAQQDIDKKMCKRALKIAIKFIKEKYPNTPIHKDLKITFSNKVETKTKRFETSMWYQGHRIDIRLKESMTMYKLKTAGRTAPKGRLHIGKELIATVHLIHEITHHIQDIEGRYMSETETTMNEIDFFRVNYRKIYNKLTIVKA